MLHCSDGSVSVTLVAESASRVLQDDIILPLCPVAIVELLLCLHVDKSVHTPGHAPTWLLLRQRGACPSSWSPEHRRVEGSRRGVCFHEEARSL